MIHLIKNKVNHSQRQSLKTVVSGWSGAFVVPFYRMQFKHILGQQDFMNRTENQEQSKAKKRLGKWDCERRKDDSQNNRQDERGYDNLVIDYQI